MAHILGGMLAAAALLSGAAAEGNKTCTTKCTVNNHTTPVDTTITNHTVPGNYPLPVNNTLPANYTLPTNTTGNDPAFRPLKWSTHGIRMNEIQVVGTHKSYHVEARPEERTAQTALADDPLDLQFSQPPLGIQLQDLRVRSLDLDVYADPPGGTFKQPLLRKEAGLKRVKDKDWEKQGAKVLNLPDVDPWSNCVTFISCLSQIKYWLEAHPESVPLSVVINPRSSLYRDPKKDHFGAKVFFWANEPLLETLETEITYVFDPDRLLTPADIKQPNQTLSESILNKGWPDLDSARGRIMFILNTLPKDPIRDIYIAGRPNLEDRIMFTHGKPGDDDCVFLDVENPQKRMKYIKQMVRRGYMVRTRADEGPSTLDGADQKKKKAKKAEKRKDAAFGSGAQVVSTDYEEHGLSARWGLDYAVKLSRDRAAQCNPVAVKADCENGEELEPAKYGRQ